MKTVLVTGPIGGGKSEVCRHLVSKGYPVYDCDSRTKMLYSLVPGLKCTICEALDTDWDNIGVIFSDAGKRETLESIVYPYVLQDILEWKRQQAGERLVFIESAIALDKPQFDGTYDEVIMVTADYETRVRRNPKAAQRSSIQKYDKEKVDYTIVNDSTIEELQQKTDKLLCRLI